MSLTAQEFESFQEFALAAIHQQAPESIEQLLDEWRLLHPLPSEHAKNVACIAAALRDMEAGDEGRPAGDVIRELRAELGLGTSQ